MQNKSYPSTHYTKSSLSKQSIHQQVKPQKSSFTRWLQRLFCIKEINEQQYITNMMEISNYDESQQPTMKIISKFSQYDEYFSIQDPIRIISGSDSQFPFVVKFNEEKLCEIDDQYHQQIPELNEQVVVLITQNPSLALINYIESKASYFIIYLSTPNPVIQDYIQQRSKQYSKPELIIGKFSIKKSLSLVDQYIFMPDYSTEGRQQVVDTVSQLLKLIPNEIDKFTFLIKLQGNPIQDIFSISSQMNEAFIQKYESEFWINKILRLSQNRNAIVLKQRDQKKTGFEKSQYMMLSNNINQKKGFNLTVENTELIMNLTKYQQGNVITHVLKCLIYQKGIEGRNNNTIDQAKLFCTLIFLIKELKRFSQYDQEDFISLMKIIQQSSLLSCCLCINLMKQEDLKELSQIKMHYKRFLEILICSGIITNEQDSYVLQSIFNKCLNCPIYDISIPKSEHLNSGENYTQQLIQNEDIGDKIYSIDYDFAKSPKSYQIVLGLQQDLNYSELQIEPQKRFPQQTTTSISNSLNE
ncbi:unnamed protein product [Paramecium pentaurelia]|uniref:Uncharacterized protein n=1 Tax=Paramecium pentaurelia TaxID=43138 RepID=A0A8S1UXX1_9CILI|nr:unnamed protein product [Paramecium pentaurelia]